VPDNDGLTRLRDAARRAGIADVAARPAMTEVDAQRFVRRATREGPGRPLEVVPPRFLGRAAATADLTGAVRFRRPEWIAELTHARKPVADVIDAVAARVLERPNEQNLRTAEVVLNDIGRREDGAQVLRDKVTQDVVDRLIAGGA
jgi:hypothetical protein